MPRTRHKTEELWTREDEVEDLRDEEQQKCLGEMRLDPHNSECHPRDIAKSISRECACRIPRTTGMSVLYYSCRVCVAYQLWNKNPAHTPTNGSMKYRLNK